MAGNDCARGADSDAVTARQNRAGIDDCTIDCAVAVDKDSGRRGDTPGIADIAVEGQDCDPGADGDAA